MDGQYTKNSFQWIPGEFLLNTLCIPQHDIQTKIIPPTKKALASKSSTLYLELANI